MKGSYVLYLIGRIQAWVQVCQLWRKEGDEVQAKGAAQDCRFYAQALADFWKQVIQGSALEFGLDGEF